MLYKSVTQYKNLEGRVAKQNHDRRRQTKGVTMSEAKEINDSKQLNFKDIFYVVSKKEDDVMEESEEYKRTKKNKMMMMKRKRGTKSEREREREKKQKENVLNILMGQKEISNIRVESVANRATPSARHRIFCTLHASAPTRDGRRRRSEER